MGLYIAKMDSIIIGEWSFYMMTTVILFKVNEDAHEKTENLLLD
jgi:hypothetical protein